MRWAIFLLAASLFTPTVGAQEGRLASPPKTIAATKLVYLSGNFMNPEEVDRCRKVMKEAAALGYTGVVVTDCKFDRWEETVTVRRPQYEANVRRLREAARQYKLQLIACVCGQGSDLLANDPNLAEGMPVQEAPFVVQGGRLVPADHDLRLVNLGLEAGSNGRVGGWSVDEVGAVDTQVKVEGKNSIRFQAIKANSSHGNGRIIQAVEVKPFRYYHLSIQVKTRDFDAPGTFNFMALGSRAGTASQQGLVHQHFDLKPTQDWTRFDIVFNTLDSERVGIYAGSWGGNKGTLWLDDLHLDPGGFVNLIRRDSLPLQITSADRKIQYEEGKDFARVVDPKLGNTLWPGAFESWYEGPQVPVPATSRLKEGQRVLASYSHAMTVLGYANFACWNEPKMWQILTRNLHAVHDVLQPDGYMMTHDEIRHMGWDESCRKTGKSCGVMLAENVKRCTELIRREDPGKPIYVWSDMFDPNHNASAEGTYYLVRGTAPFQGSWKGLDRDVIIMNWSAQEKTLAWFAGRGHRQILCGFYDAPPEKMADWLHLAVKYPGVKGVMYTTWANDYSQLARYAKIVHEFRAD